MPPTAATASPPRSRPSRRRRLATTLLVGVLATGIISTPAATGAWFTADKAVSGNAIAAASLQPVTGLTASKTSTGVNVSWNSALQLGWATSNSVTGEPTYTVTRTIDGANPTVIATGTNKTATDVYPAGVQVTPVTFDAGSGVAGYVTNDGSVMTWGASTSGLLGSPYSAVRRPGYVSLPSQAYPVTSIAMNSNSAVAIGANGTLWGWGMAPQAGCTGAWTNTPTQITLPSGVKAVAASIPGDCALLVLDSAGGLWQRGGTANNGKFAKTSTSWVKVTLPDGRAVKQLTKAETVLSSDGWVWSWGGTNSSGEYGVGIRNYTTETPTSANLYGRTMRQISTDGTRSVVALGEDGSIYAWGSNSYGQLGIGSIGDSYPEPIRLDVRSTGTGAIREVQTAGGTTTFASYGAAWSVGSNKNGRLGINGYYPEQTGSWQRVYAYPENSGGLVLSTQVGGQSYVRSDGLYAWGLGSDRSDVAYFGNNDSTNVQTSPIKAQSPFNTASTTPTLVCSNGGTGNSSNRCAPNGTVTYSVTYPYMSWQSVAASANAG